ncbi:MAG: hypothetical protein P0120_00655 [Nitrospira sp.]|nr:hypothetical protein [Nitrospira sp.]
MDRSFLVAWDGMRHNGPLPSPSPTSIDETYVLQPSQPFGIPLRSTTIWMGASSPAGRQPRQAQVRLEADPLTLFRLDERAPFLLSYEHRTFSPRVIPLIACALDA